MLLHICIDKFLIKCTGEPPPPFLDSSFATVKHKLLLFFKRIVLSLSNINSCEFLHFIRVKISGLLYEDGFIQTSKLGKNNSFFFNLFASKP